LGVISATPILLFVGGRTTPKGHGSGSVIPKPATPILLFVSGRTTPKGHGSGSVIPKPATPIFPKGVAPHFYFFSFFKAFILI